MMKALAAIIQRRSASNVLGSACFGRLLWRQLVDCLRMQFGDEACTPFVCGGDTVESREELALLWRVFFHRLPLPGSDATQTALADSEYHVVRDRRAVAYSP